MPVKVLNGISLEPAFWIVSILVSRMNLFCLGFPSVSGVQCLGFDHDGLIHESLNLKLGIKKLFLMHEHGNNAIASSIEYSDMPIDRLLYYSWTELISKLGCYKY